jgi:hypothetical protein
VKQKPSLLTPDQREQARRYGENMPAGGRAQVQRILDSGARRIWRERLTERQELEREPAQARK